jgi:hypothetical protein
MGSAGGLLLSQKRAQVLQLLAAFERVEVAPLLLRKSVEDWESPLPMWVQGKTAERGGGATEMNESVASVTNIELPP